LLLKLTAQHLTLKLKKIIFKEIVSKNKKYYVQELKNLIRTSKYGTGWK